MVTNPKMIRKKSMISC